MKDVEVKARVTKITRAKLDDIATERGESLSVIVREALNDYLAGNKGVDATPENYGPKKVIPLPRKISYSKEARKKKRRSSN